MVTLRALRPDDATALTRIYSGASIRHTTGKPLTLDQAHEKIRTALARAVATPRAQRSWDIVATDEIAKPPSRGADQPVAGRSYGRGGRTS